MNSKRLLSLVLIFCLFITNNISILASVIITEPQVVVIEPEAYEIYNQDGGFVITQAMLDMPYNRITFPGTHNSFAGSGFPGSERNQDLSITDQLNNGIRVLDFDVDMFLGLRHGSTAVDFNARLKEVKNYAAAHPRQIITVRINDYASTSGNMFSRINGRLEDTGLDDYIYNWDSSVAKDQSGRCAIPTTWPTLRQMIDSGNNVMFIHQSSESGHNIVDSSAYRGLSSSDYRDNSTHHHYDAHYLEEFSRVQNIWDPANNDRQNSGANRLFHIEVCPDGSTAGDRNAATKNNDGRRLYQIAKQYETELLPNGRVPYVIAIDFFKNNNVDNLPINVVDACNRLNAERAGIDFARAPYKWELYPYEFDYTKKDIIQNLSHIRNEVNSVYNDFKAGRDLDGHEDRGDVVSTTYQRLYDFDHLPEHAVDNDLNTRWTGSSARPNHTWGIDLGQRYELTDIAIAWEFSHKIPAYTVYVSNDDRRFRDDMNNRDLSSDAGWTKAIIHSNERGNLSTPIPWDMGSISGSYRYIKIKVTDADNNYWPSISEVKVFGPSDIDSTGLVGGSGGNRNWAPSGTYTHKLRSVTLMGGDRLYGIQTNYDNGTSSRMGRYYNIAPQSLTLAANEYIQYANVGVAWTNEYSNNTIHYLSLITNTGRRIEQGTPNGLNVINFTAPSGYHINGFWGRSGYEVDQLAVMIKRN